jgi:lipoprotein signal peptidase
MTDGQEERRSARSITLMVVSLVLLTASDLATKEWALEELSQPNPSADTAAVCQPDKRGHIEHQREPIASRPLVEGVLRLHYTENCGAAFSMLRTAPGWLRMLVFGGASVGATVVLISMFVRGAGGPLFAGAVPLIVSGAIGNNLHDRPRHGFVVDFLQVDPALFNYPIFNVADIWIAIGVGLLLLDSLRSKRSAPAETPVSATASSGAKP